MKAAFLLHVINSTPNMSDEYFIVAKCAVSEGRAYYTKNISLETIIRLERNVLA